MPFAGCPEGSICGVAGAMPPPPHANRQEGAPVDHPADPTHLPLFRFSCFADEILMSCLEAYSLVTVNRRSRTISDGGRRGPATSFKTTSGPDAAGSAACAGATSTRAFQRHGAKRRVERASEHPLAARHSRRPGSEMRGDVSRRAEVGIAMGPGITLSPNIAAAAMAL
jgi:hypothetical protein